MLKYIRWRENYIKFHNGINYSNDYDIVDAAGTIFGGFTGAFAKGHGRRLDIPQDEVEISMSGCVKFNDKTFNFTRVYTNLRADTDDMDKRQDISKYASKLDKAFSGTKEEEKNVKLPIFLYYNDELKYNSIQVKMEENEVILDRTLGYANSLIVFNKFEVAQKYLVLASFIAWQMEIADSENKLSRNFRKAIKNINDAIKKIGYSNIRYNLEKNDITVEKAGKEIGLKDIKNNNDKFFIAILLDINMRALMLNVSFMENVFDAEGSIVISYIFDKEILTTLVNKIHESFPNLQLIVYEREEKENNKN